MNNDIYDQREALYEAQKRAETYNEQVRRQTVTREVTYLHPNRLKDLEEGYLRYEFLRTLNPRQFQELWEKCLRNEGVRFDDEVDRMRKERDSEQT